jgi:membrane associated rhomboid family serine protease
MPPARAPLTHGLALLCGAVHLLLLVSGRHEWAVPFAGFIPARWEGVSFGPGVPALLSPLTAALLHAHVLHLAMNVLILVFVGRQLEPVLGPRLFALLLLAGVYGAAVAEWLFAVQGNIVIIGASGAISALVAAFAFIFNRNQVRAIGPIPAVVVRAAWLAAAWIGLQFAIGWAAGGGIAILSHIGGFVAGLLLTRPLLRWRFG